MDGLRRGLRNLKSVVPFIALLIVFAAGCAKPPQVDIDAAKASIDGAVAAEANDYAKGSLTAANDSWSALQTELTAQEQKFALFRSYKNATAMAADAKAKGDKAKSDADARKAQVKADVESAMAAATAALTEAKDMLDKAPKGKGTAQDIEMLKGDLTGVETSLADAGQLHASGKYLQAQAKLSAAMSRINDVKTQVQAAIDAKKK